MKKRATVLFYCQHSLGMGHLMRSLNLASALCEDFRVVLLNGGRFPKKLTPHPAIEIVNLPPLGLDENNTLVSRDKRRSVEQAQERRRQIILDTYEKESPQILLVELFPFGRKKFAGELMPLLEGARGKSKIVCSLRDILVGRSDGREKFEERVMNIVNEYFDGILIHSDPSFARLHDSFRMAGELKAPVFYTGFVVPPNAPTTRKPRRSVTKKVLVSAGGGLVGESLLRTAIEAHAIMPDKETIRMEIIGGPFLPEADWNSIRSLAQGNKKIRFRRFVGDLAQEMADADLSVSQCGYNTSLDILRSGVSAVVIPFGDAASEDEQTRRARSLEQLGALRVCDSLTPTDLARKMSEVLEFRPELTHLDMNGGKNSSRILLDLLRRPARSSRTESWLEPVRKALRQREKQVKVFFRDDDAGVDDCRLFKLIDLFHKFAMPLDIAVIPKLATPKLANELTKRLNAASGLLAIHQHGFAHVNHEVEGRKCEFGQSRAKANQFSDICRGLSMLEDLFGPLMQPIFTPPWNRCSPGTVEVLEMLGFKVLSRESRAQPIVARALTEIPVGVDWFAKRKGVALTRDELGMSIAEQLLEKDTVGLMFHHELMGTAERRALRELVDLLSASPVVEARSMWNLYTEDLNKKREGTGTAVSAGTNREV